MRARDFLREYSREKTAGEKLQRKNCREKTAEKKGRKKNEG